MKALGQRPLLPKDWEMGDNVFCVCRRVAGDVRLEIMYLASEKAFLGKIQSPLTRDYGITVDLTTCKSLWTAARTMNSLYKDVMKRYAEQQSTMFIQ